MELIKMYGELGISEKVLNYGREIEKSLHDRFEAIDKTAEYNQLKVIKAMQEARVSDIHFAGTTGYGYNDLGRDTLEEVYAKAFHGEDALVRPQLISGTHALTIALSGNLRPGDEILSPVGKPYDTLEEVIGIRDSVGSLKEFGITYSQVDLLPNGDFDFENIKKAINERTKLIEIQRSKGYATRPTLSVKRIGELISFIKSIKPDVICMVDNCYGEFVEEMEPTDVGADMIVGSLIKNLGGGLAPIGGYIVGKKECVDNAAYRLIVTEAQTSMNKLYDMAAVIGGAMAVVSSDDPVEQVQGYYLAAAAKERLDIPRNERYQIISLEGAGEDIYNSVLQAVSSDEGLKPFVDTAYSAMGDFDPDSADTSGVQIDSIQIEPSENVEVPQGSTYQFTASVSSPQGDLDAVKWSVSGATAEGTTINNNGVLSVDGNELSQTLTVTATSAFDADASASVTVRVTDRIYVDPTIPVNLGPSATILGSSGSSAAGEGPENIFDDLDTTKWCPGNGTNTNQWVAFDLGSVKQISSWQLVGGGIEHALYAPSSFALQVLIDEDPSEEELSSSSYLSNNANWRDVSRYDNNSENIVNTTFDELVEGRYFRLYIYNGSQTGAPYPATRIFETRVYGVDKAIVERTHALTIDPEIEHGSISVDAAHFEEGAKVNVYIEPNEGYQLKEGSLNYNGTAVEGTSFLMPGEDVVLSAELSRPEQF